MQRPREPEQGGARGGRVKKNLLMLGPPRSLLFVQQILKKNRPKWGRRANSKKNKRVYTSSGRFKCGRRGNLLLLRLETMKKRLKARIEMKSQHLKSDKTNAATTTKPTARNTQNLSRCEEPRNVNSVRPIRKERYTFLRRYESPYFSRKKIDVDIFWKSQNGIKTDDTTQLSCANKSTAQLFKRLLKHLIFHFFSVSFCWPCNSFPAGRIQVQSESTWTQYRKETWNVSSWWFVSIGALCERALKN